ncbi:MAG: TPM domain-containing protein [Desulfobacterales bacterium]|nr:TPM domain-containing protein [Desulfobacterales bacterium]
MILRRSLKLAIPILILLVYAASQAVELPRQPSAYVVDLAGIIEARVEQQINGYLQELEQKTTAQFVILTIQSLESEPIEELAIRVAHDQWQLGQKGKDNGVLLLVALKDRRYRIEVGYGLEAILPDSLVGSIGRHYLVPFFKKGDYSNGIYTAGLVIANIIAEDSSVTISGMPRIRGTTDERRTKESVGLGGTIFSLLVLLVIFGLFIRNPRLFLLLFFMSSMGGRRGHWGGGGGFGGGGFGSFGGGGGGGFGGGGASGGW